MAPRKTPLTQRVWSTINSALALLEADDLEDAAESEGISVEELDRRIQQARKAVWDRLED